MKRTSFLLVGIFLLAWATFHFDHLMAKGVTPGGTIETMSADQQSKTGISKLTAMERKALQDWIAQNYSRKTKGEMQPQVSEVLGNGMYVKLTDDTMWKIHPQDTPITASWITPVEIIVQKNGTPPYPYTLKNSLTGSVVRAQAASSLPSDLEKAPTPPPSEEESPS